MIEDRVSGWSERGNEEAGMWDEEEEERSRSQQSSGRIEGSFP